MKRQAASPEELLALKKYHIPVERMCAPGRLEYAPGEMICRDGEPADKLIFLLRGQAKVFVSSEAGENLMLCLLDGSGVLDDLDIFLNEGVYHSCCQALSAVVCIAYPMAENRGILLSSNEFLTAESCSFAKSLQRNRNHFNNILYPLDSRLCSYIAAAESGGVWNDNLSRVSEMLGVSYRHLLRTLQALCGRGILRKTGCGYEIADYPALKKYDTGFFPIVE